VEGDDFQQKYMDEKFDALHDKIDLVIGGVRTEMATGQQANLEQHKELARKSDKMFNRIFVTNGKQSITDNLAEHRSRIDTIKSDVSVLQKYGRRYDDIEMTGKEKAKYVAKAGGKWTAIAAIAVAMLKLLEGCLS
jgi:hypothetical protein